MDPTTHANDAQKRASKRSRVTEEDYKYLSGPEVWPCLIAEEARDRFIFQRPEINYLIGTREWAEKKKDLSFVRVSLSKVTRRNGRLRQEAFGSFVHQVDKESEFEDIKKLLRELRNYLARTMPQEPVLGLTLRLSFDGPREAYVASFSAPWL